jgi:hypothetical protein
MQRLASNSMVFTGYCGDDCASESEQRAARGMVQGLKTMDDTRERIVALEVKVDHLSEQLRMAANKLDDIHADWQKAKGAKWIMAGMAAIAGSLSTLAIKFWPFVR